MAFVRPLIRPLAGSRPCFQARSRLTQAAGSAPPPILLVLPVEPRSPPTRSATTFQSFRATQPTRLRLDTRVILPPVSLLVLQLAAIAWVALRLLGIQPPIPGTPSRC